MFPHPLRSQLPKIQTPQQSVNISAWPEVVKKKLRNMMKLEMTAESSNKILNGTEQRRSKHLFENVSKMQTFK